MKQTILYLILCLLFTSCFTVTKNDMKSAKEYKRVIPGQKLTSKSKNFVPKKRFEEKTYSGSTSSLWKASIAALEFFEAAPVREFKGENKIIGRIQGDFAIIWIEKDGTDKTRISIKVLPKLSTYFITKVNEEDLFKKIEDFTN